MINKMTEGLRTTVLKSGSKITRPLSYAPLAVIIIIIVGAFFWDSIVTDYFSRVTAQLFLSRVPNFFDIVAKMVAEVEWSYSSQILSPMIDTIQMAIMGTVIGAAIALPVAFLASQNIIKNSAVSIGIKSVLSLLRTFPTLVYALIMSFVFGYGTFIGFLATAIFTFAIMTKLLYEVIETIDLGAFTAIESTGASKVRAFSVAVLPQIMPAFLSTSLYSFEINIRGSAILGLVGAGGIGIMLNDSMGLRNYGRVSLMLIVLLATVIVIESASREIRRKLG
jgi:phosphonate transport system permease protein